MSTFQDQDQAGSNVNTESRPPDNVVFTIMNNKVEDRATSFFAQPGILAGEDSMYSFYDAVEITKTRIICTFHTFSRHIVYKL